MTDKYKIPTAVKKTPRCPLCYAMFDRKWIPSRRMDAFFCHFCKISVMCNDPFIGRWEETYAKGEKIHCPACDTVMRYFATSTGYVLVQCPKKKCKARMELSSPDRKKGEVKLYDSRGEPIELPNINKAISTPDQPGVTQIFDAPVEPAPPTKIDLLH